MHLSAAQASQILSRKRRPNLGRLTVSPDLESPRASSPDVQSPRASGDRSRQKLQLPVRAPALRGAGKDQCGSCFLVLREEN